MYELNQQHVEPRSSRFLDILMQNCDRLYTTCLEFELMQNVNILLLLTVWTLQSFLSIWKKETDTR